MVRHQPSSPENLISNAHINRRWREGRAQVEHLPFIAHHIVFHLILPFIDIIAGNVAEADVLVVYLR